MVLLIGEQLSSRDYPTPEASRLESRSHQKQQIA
jgi:hypothetical protein